MPQEMLGAKVDLVVHHQLQDSQDKFKLDQNLIGLNPESKK
jgi:hypothetical protein